ncbi:MAG: LysR family transcriptional regulator [Proteobacteria bacterium]|nr:LysR family transcriptional regulator [Pseudomonadota bacterium]
MELVDLKVFASVVENQTTTRAAKALGMTQPGVSKHLARLENGLGGQLFQRRGKYLALNDFGRFYYERVKKLLSDVRELSSLNYGSSSPVGELKLGLTDAATLIITPPSLVEFRKRYPGVHISLDVDSSTEIEEGVLSGAYDLGVVTGTSRRNPRLMEEVLYTDSLDVLVAASHRLARRRFVQLEELAGLPLIISPRRRRTRVIIEGVFKAHGVRIGDTVDVYNHSAAARLAEADLGVALLPRESIREQLLFRKCASVRIAGDPVRRTLSIIMKKGIVLSEAVKIFHAMMVERGRSVAL